MDEVASALQEEQKKYTSQQVKKMVLVDTDGVIDMVVVVVLQFS